MEKRKIMAYEVMETIKSKNKTKTKKTRFDKHEDALRYAAESKHRTEVYQLEYRKIN
ncbi:hypothetical protein NWP08_07515 [Lactococcus petauri]|uniref:hypothetical protein n=1 Tax=Lactococcus petauri TaxID=1940789 RepID=UPI00215A48B7|nr:hypothetical protein [Lactococcus petauri]MCR8688778.1 hypothetical protein [Lactococcus petauri]